VLQANVVEKIKTHMYVKIFFPKIVTFMKKCGRIW